MRAATLALAVVMLAPVTAASSFTFTAIDFAWTPNFATAVVGDTATFVLGSGIHNVKFDSAPVCSLPCTKPLDTVGLKSFFCTVHGGAMAGNIRVLASSGPDLAVDLVPGPVSTSVTQASLRVDWRNQGTEATGATTSILLEYADPAGARDPITTIAFTSMGAGTAATRTVVWSDGHVRAGTFQVFATIDPDGAIAEVDEGNNADAGTATFVLGALPKSQV